MLLQLIKKQSMILCSNAVNQNWRSIKYVKTKYLSPQLCLNAIVQSIRDTPNAIVYTNIKKYADILNLIIKQLFELRAFQDDLYSRLETKSNTHRKRSSSLQHSTQRSSRIPRPFSVPELNKNNKYAYVCTISYMDILSSIKKQILDLTTIQHELSLRLNIHKSPAVAIRQNCMFIKLIKNQTPELCMLAVKQNWRTLQYIDKKKLPANVYTQLCLEAINQHRDAIYLVKR
jgi:hypothetical protein